MERDLANILTEVLIFPYQKEVVDALMEACSKFVEEINLSQYEDCVLYLCLDMPATDLIESIKSQTGREFPNRVYRAMAGCVVGEALARVSDEDDKVMFPLALRNVLKAKTDDVDGIISKTIDPACFAAVEDYWAENINIPSLCGKDMVSSTIFDNSNWRETGLDIDESFGDIQALAKYYRREQFKKKFAGRNASENQDIYAFALQIADEIAAQDWLFTAENPVAIFKSLKLKGTAISLNNIKSRVLGVQDAEADIDYVSVYRRYLYANDYEELGAHRINPLNFGIAIFYELLYERLKTEKYE